MTEPPAAERQLSDQPVELIVGQAEAELRLDIFLAMHFTAYSRGHLRRVITAGGATIDGRGSKPAFRLRPGQCVRVVLPEIPRQSPRPEDIPLDILYQDDELVVVNKPAGMVVHPARGHWSGTLAGALQFHFGPALSSSGGPTRPGIVHRLDRDTSGVILVARTDQAHLKLAAQFQHRTIEKEYFAIVAGRPDRDRDVIDRADRRASPAAREDGDLSATMRPAAGADVLRGPGAVRRLRRPRSAAEDGPHAPDPRPPQPYRLPGAVRPPIRRPARRSPAARSAATRPTAWCCWPGRRSMPGGSAWSIPPAARRWRSRPPCPPTSPASWRNYDSTGSKAEGGGRKGEGRAAADVVAHWPFLPPSALRPPPYPNTSAIRSRVPQAAGAGQDLAGGEAGRHALLPGVGAKAVEVPRLDRAGTGSRSRRWPPSSSPMCRRCRHHRCRAVCRRKLPEGQETSRAGSARRGAAGRRNNPPTSTAGRRRRPPR